MNEIQTEPLAEAAAWRTRLTEQDRDSCAEFEAWLAADPRNASAWRQVQGPWGVVGEQATAPEIIELRRRALAHAHEAGQARWARTQRFARTGRLAVAASVLAIAIGAGVIWRASQPDVYRTAAGERRVVTLSDGSQVALDSRSEVKVRYTAQARELVLVSGQARFDVTHDVERPFSVAADGHKVVATGTAFNVDLFAASLLVTMIEGHVVVLPETTNIEHGVHDTPAESSDTPHSSSAPRGRQSAPASSRIALEAGEQLVLSPTAPPSISHVNVERATAWENGEIIFENDPLSTVIARINRYTQHRLVIADEQTSELRISGVFHTGDVDGFVSTIVSYLPVQAHRSPDGSTELTHL